MNSPAATTILVLLALVSGSALAQDYVPSATPPKNKCSSYPEEAIRARLRGDVAMECAVKPDGYLTDCKVILETPPGHGFARGAIACIAPTIRMTPGYTNAPRVRIPVHFEPGAQQPTVGKAAAP
jgi:TonB family protein